MTPIDTASAEIIETAHWAPPVAPLDMPAQVLERRAAPVAARGLSRLWLSLAPRLRA
ncbi:hypothetical protein LCM17_14710 [Cereibacter sphaeroides]|nr:hypothetical protein [Cereibacter sphaeroides]